MLVNALRFNNNVVFSIFARCFYLVVLAKIRGTMNKKNELFFFHYSIIWC